MERDRALMLSKRPGSIGRVENASAIRSAACVRGAKVRPQLFRLEIFRYSERIAAYFSKREIRGYHVEYTVT